MPITPPSPSVRPERTGLENWRLAPYSSWAFHNLRELLPTAVISAGENPVPPREDYSDVPSEFRSAAVSDTTLQGLLIQSNTDCMVILHQGKKIWQWCAPHCDITKPHIVFSISKSITGILAGILVDHGLIDVKKPVAHYLPDTKGSAYEDSTVQHVLDMTVALAFEESYLDTNGDYQQYRDATCWNPVNQTCPGPSLEAFLYTLGKAHHDHGKAFSYKSPNSDLLGLLLERVSGIPYADLLSSLIWQPMAAETDGYVTVDRAMLARGAGGICITVDDLARFGQLVLNAGTLDGRNIIPESWIHDTLTRGNREAWMKGDFSGLLPNGRYRNQWYQIGDQNQCYTAIGIHSQWLYINPTSSVVIAKLSSQPEPVDDNLDSRILDAFSKLSKAL